MATVKIDKFGGVVPRVHPSLLPDGAATVAHNCRLKSGKLVPLRQPSVVDANEHTVYHENGLTKISDANSVYCWKHTRSDGTVRTDFLAFPGRVYFAHGNIADDERDRVFVTGETGIDFTTAEGEVRTNCPAVYLWDRQTGEIERHCICKNEMDAPRCELATNETISEAGQQEVMFFFSWVDKYGYESPSSWPSRNGNRDENGNVMAYGDSPLLCSQSSLIKFQPVFVPLAAVAVRVYRTVSGTPLDGSGNSQTKEDTSAVQFCYEFGAGELNSLKNSFTIRLDNDRIGEVMPEIESPPFDLCDMTFVPGNFYAGRSPSMPHTVLFSDVDNPTNWSAAYRYDVRDNVVKLAVTANSVFALTDGTPFVLTGTAPESMTVASLAQAAACVSEKSVCVTGNAVFFASNQGLMAIRDGADSGTTCTNLTEQYFTKEQWQGLNPASCVMGAFDNALHMFFTKRDGTREAYIFDLTESANALTTHDEFALCVAVDDRSDDLYFVRWVEEA